MLALFPVALTAFWMFDRLVRLEYASYKESWEEDGRPHGFLFVASETKALGGFSVRLGSSLAFLRCFFAWLFEAPEWMRQDQRALRWVFWYRVSVLTFNVMGLGRVLSAPYLRARGYM